MNSFAGKFETAELFPYPDGEWRGVGWEMHPDKYDLLMCSICCHLYAVLTDEQRQNASMFVDPVTKFFEVILQ